MGEVYAAILAGGSGTRMGNPDEPKQFWDLCGRPVVAHTIEKFCLMGEFDEVIVLVPDAWVIRTRDIVNRYLSRFSDKVSVVAGGATRNDTIMAAIRHIGEVRGLTPETIIVTHDAVRPFVTYRIIAENIEAARKWGACDTVVPATDTIVCSEDGEFVSSIPNRSQYYQGQTPQSFRAALLQELFCALDEEQKAILTDACKVFALHGKPVALVRGDVANMKLTYPEDMRIARAMMADAELVQDVEGDAETAHGAPGEAPSAKASAAKAVARNATEGE